MVHVWAVRSETDAVVEVTGFERVRGTAVGDEALTVAAAVSEAEGAELVVAGAGDLEDVGRGLGVELGVAKVRDPNGSEVRIEGRGHRVDAVGGVSEELVVGEIGTGGGGHLGVGVADEVWFHDGVSVGDTCAVHDEDAAVDAHGDGGEAVVAVRYDHADDASFERREVLSGRVGSDHGVLVLHETGDAASAEGAAGIVGARVGDGGGVEVQLDDLDGVEVGRFRVVVGEDAEFAAVDGGVGDGLPDELDIGGIGATCAGAGVDGVADDGGAGGGEVASADQAAPWNETAWLEGAVAAVGAIGDAVAQACDGAAEADGRGAAGGWDGEWHGGSGGGVDLSGARVVAAGAISAADVHAAAAEEGCPAVFGSEAAHDDAEFDDGRAAGGLVPDGAVFRGEAGDDGGIADGCASALFEGGDVGDEDDFSGTEDPTGTPRGADVGAVHGERVVRLDVTSGGGAAADAGGGAETTVIGLAVGDIARAQVGRADEVQHVEEDLGAVR